MNKNLSLLLIVLVYASLFLSAAAAARLPPKTFVNHRTTECAALILGDECTDCFVPAGWEELGMYGDVTCPEDYTEIDLRPECQPFKIARCCTEGHSGAAGDCEDLVINRLKRQCAFVGDINTTQLSGSWQSRPVDVPVNGWVCPGNFTWQEKPLTAAEMQTGFPVLLAVLACLCSVSLLTALIAIFIVLNQRKKNSG